MSKDITALLSELSTVDRRIDNMRYLVVFQEQKRERIIGDIRRSLGRDEPRTTFIDFDARRDPATARWCVMCQRDLAPDRDAGELRLVQTASAGPHAVHVDDVPLLDAGILALPPRCEDHGRALIGLDCAKRLGAGWWRPETPKNDGN